MNYSFNYKIVSVHYNERTRVTEVSIVNSNTGEVFYGTARRNPKDDLNMSLATNLATMRAVRKGMLSDFSFERAIIIERGKGLFFKC